MKNKKTTSVVVIAKNEEKKIAACLKSVQWADEIIVLDNASKDKTSQIAEKYGARVVPVSQKFDLQFYQLRNKGLNEAKGDWIFYLDADERVTPELKEEILRIIHEGELFAYAIPRRNFILGQEMKHGGWYPDYVKRLFKKEKIEGWRGKLHEEPVFEGELGHLRNPMLHQKHADLSEMMDKTNAWSQIEAELMFKAHHPEMNIRRFLTAILREFWLRMIKKMAFLDGPKGIIYALYQVFSRFISYAKLWEMQISK